VSDAAGKPLPHPDRDSEPFWRGLREGALRVQRCGGCGALRWPAREVCNRCHDFASEWIALSGRGRIVSWVRTHQVFAPAWRDELPYDVVLVAQDEQEDLQLIGRFEGAGPEAGLRVRARFVRVDDAVTLLHWEQDDSDPRR
jgi:uncharacterized OB-fold protein